MSNILGSSNKENQRSSSPSRRRKVSIQQIHAKSTTISADSSMEVNELLKDERLESGGGLFLLDRGVWEGKKVREVQEGGVALRAADRDSKASFEELMRLQAERYQEENRVAREAQREEDRLERERERLELRALLEVQAKRFDDFRSHVKKDAKSAKEETTLLREEVVLLKEAITSRDVEIEEIKEKLVMWENNSFDYAASSTIPLLTYAIASHLHQRYQITLNSSQRARNPTLAKVKTLNTTVLQLRATIAILSEQKENPLTREHAKLLLHHLKDSDLRTKTAHSSIERCSQDIDRLLLMLSLLTRGDKESLLNIVLNMKEVIDGNLAGDM